MMPKIADNSELLSAALDSLKRVVADFDANFGFVNSRALQLVGEPEEKIEAELRAIGEGLSKGLEHEQGFSEAMAFGIALATCQLIRERICRFSINGGRA